MANDNDLNRNVALLRQLVEIESQTADVAGVNAVADVLEAELRAAGLTVRRTNPSHGACGDVIEAWIQSDAAADVLLLGHMDTVYARGTLQRWPFSISSARAHGPGVADMKGGLVCMVALARRLRTVPLNLALVFNSDEETGSPHSGACVRAWARRSRYVLVFEPARPNGALVTARKGVAAYAIEWHGKPAHAGVAPQDGVSAISELARWTLALDARTDYAHGTTVNMGLVSGGEAKNIVAAHATGTLEIRFTDRAVPARIEACMQQLAASARPGLRAEWRQIAFRPPMNPDERTHALCVLAQRAAAEAGIGALTFEATGGASDANLAADEGAVCLDGMGPLGGCMHTPDEYLELDTFAPRIQFAEGLIRALCAAAQPSPAIALQRQMRRKAR